jgi:pimeloyl-ACP methyl ester carboxylesterase
MADKETTMLKRLLITPLALALILGVSGARSSPADRSAATPVRNIVLVHGAFADGSSYAKVIPLLQSKGFRVTAVQNPLSSLADDVAATRRAIAMQDGPVILVGHSWGGMAVSEAGNDPKVVGLVYIAAIVPDVGQTANDVLKPYPPTPGLGHMTPDAAGYLSLTRQGIEEDFVPDLPARERALVFATQGPWNSTALAEAVPTPAWTTKPSWFIAVNDRILPADYEHVIAKRINARTTTLPSGHVPMLSRPKDVAAVIIDAANSAGTSVAANSAGNR